ncbi:MAG: ATP-binding protein [Candidatus Poribacteria bacterium]
MLTIGKEIDKDEYVYINAARSRVALVCGKRGSGKSYTLGVFVEELIETEDVIVIIIDPMGIYHTMALPNREQEQVLRDWGLRAREAKVKLLVPGEAEELYGGAEIISAMQRRGVIFQALRINPSDMTPDGWCELFDLTLNEPMGIVLYRAVQELQRRMRRTGQPFSIEQMISQVERDKRAVEKTREALLLRLEMAKDWGIFADEYQSILDFFEPKIVNVIDLSVIDPGRYGLRNLIVDVVCRDLFRKRTIDRRREELHLPTRVPKIWLAMDEAQQFIPSAKSSLSKETLIRWVKEGRQPGLSLIVASQQPAAIDGEVLSQCDILLAHKITALEDVQAINKLSQDYMSSELRNLIKRIKGSGFAVLVDDEEELAQTIKIRPRKSKHGGGESAVGRVATFKI